MEDSRSVSCLTARIMWYTLLLNFVRIRKYMGLRGVIVFDGSALILLAKC